MPRLPLFPLGTVLAPGERLPLRIFESRYVVMLRDVLRGDGRGEHGEFGVIAIRAGEEVGEGRARELADVGCAARLVAVSEADDGFDVVAEGTRRFRLEGTDEEARTPYLSGIVTWLPDRVRDPALAKTLAERLRGELAAYRAAVGLAPVALPADVTGMSFAAMHLVRLDVADRQELLADRDVDRRLRRALSLTRREATLQSVLGAMPGRYVPSRAAAN